MPGASAAAGRAQRVRAGGDAAPRSCHVSCSDQGRRELPQAGGLRAVSGCPGPSDTKGHFASRCPVFASVAIAGGCRAARAGQQHRGGFGRRSFFAQFPPSLPERPSPAALASRTRKYLSWETSQDCRRWKSIKTSGLSGHVSAFPCTQRQKKGNLPCNPKILLMMRKGN